MQSGTFTSIPTGQITPTLVGHNFIAPYTMEASFSVAIPCACPTGLYRQFVRGTFTHNGVNFPHTIAPGRILDATNFQEDAHALGPYGHRERAAITGDQYLPQQAGGCVYRGDDTPGLWGIPSGDTAGINLEFLGILLDSTNTNILRTGTWSIVGTTTVP